jgi:hypothetical protein
MSWWTRWNGYNFHLMRFRLGHLLEMLSQSCGKLELR